MANLLFQLGRFASRRSWTFLLSWLAVLAIAGGSFLAFGGTLTSSLSIPGTETERVTDELNERLEGIGGATATVVFRAEDDEALTETQREEISALLADIADIEGVDSTVDPFETEAERAAQQQEIEDALAEVEAGEQQLDDAQAQLDAGQEQLDAGQEQLDAAIAQAQAAGVYEQAQAQFDAQQAQLDAQQELIDETQAQIDEGRADLEEGREQLEIGQRLIDAASGFGTVSDDESTVVGVVSFESDLFGLSSELKEEVASALDEAEIEGVQVDYSSTIAESIEGLLGPGEIIGVVIAAIVLLIMLRSLLPAVLPLISSVIGVGIGVAGSLAFSGVVDMTSVTPVLGVMLGLAVGIDYSLFIINRHRTQVRAGMAVRESIGLANGTAGNAVVFAGATVIIALLALNVTGIPFLGVMGTVAAMCVFIAVLIAVSLTPALLGLVGERVLSRRERAHVGRGHAAESIRPMRTLSALGITALSIVGLLVIAIPALSLRLGLPDGASEPEDSTQYRSYTAIAEEFGAGQNGSIIVTAALDEPVAEEDETATQADIADALLERDDIVAVLPVGVSEERDYFAFQVVPVDGPSSESTENLVNELRADSPLDADIELGVAGQASGNIDVSQKLQDVLPLYLGVVVGLSLLIMIVVFRSILVPVIATAGFVLSLFASLGAVTAVYQWGWLPEISQVHNPGPVLSFAPLIIMGVLFGLAMDYQLFLASGMREAFVHGIPARAAVIAGRRNARAVVTAAAIIMISVFGGFMFSHLTMVRPLGFGLAIGVLFDAFIVRLLLVPALMHLVGEKAWWMPRWLDRILPNADVEGAALERDHPVPHAHEEQVVAR
ncbi:MMPL family transporter [Salinibacterium sp. SYSU T00001]|uniref:MMPL family transporter n=1 Tax=Homoserinimonas sedimenticola TaxID=2986805 RepID=UPI002235D0E9|nr:MMPL family transporter [Salinibacterium sedimenticola]MCW4385994.1 MMPL family transporter [Salinibacterium sedimenticola]